MNSAVYGSQKIHRKNCCLVSSAGLLSSSHSFHRVFALVDFVHTHYFVWSQVWQFATYVRRDFQFYPFHCSVYWKTVMGTLCTDCAFGLSPTWNNRNSCSSESTPRKPKAPIVSSNIIVLSIGSISSTVLLRKASGWSMKTACRGS